MLRRSRWRVLAAAALLLGLLVPGAGSAAGPCKAVAITPDGWERVRQPAGLATVKVVATSPSNRKRVWVSDGFSVARTSDGGCTWRVVHRLSAFITLGAQDADSYITQVLVSGPSGAETVWVVEQGGSLAGERLSTVAVARGGSDEFETSNGLPPVGGARLAVGRDPRVAYALVRPLLALGLGGSLDAGVYSTGDAGESWQRRADLPAGFLARGADVSARGTLFTWSDTEVLAFDPAVSRVREVDLPEARVSTVSVGNLLVVFPGGSTALVSTDEGSSFAPPRPTPAGVTGATEVPGSLLVALAAEGRALLWHLGTGRLADVTPDRLNLGGLTAAGGGDPAVVGRSGAVLASYPLNAPRPAVRKPTRVTLVPPAPKLLEEPVLAPQGTTLQLRPGEVRRVGYRLSLPPVPGPLDVYFLIDTTGSMQPAIDGLRKSIQEIVNALAQTNLDVHIGLGDFRDIDQNDLAGGAVYRRAQRIAPPGEGLRRALQELSLGGGGDEAEADTIALTEAVHGTGRPGVVQAGQEAGFRPGSTRAVVLITDAPFHTEAPVYPTHEESAEVLVGAGVKVLGLAVGERGRPDLEQVARSTGTATPAGGIDCDDDGDSDVSEGEPAVCEISREDRGPARLEQPIIALLRAVAQPGRVVVRGQGEAVAQVVGQVDQVLDLARPQPVLFAVDYACASDDGGRLLDGRISATADGRPLAQATAQVRCGGIPVPAPPQARGVVEQPAPVPVEQQPLALSLPAVAPPPPAQVPQGQPVTNPQAVPQPGTVVNPNLIALTAEQQQEQLDLVYAEQEVEAFGDEELAMAAQPGRDESAAARRLLATALLMASVAGVAGWRRQRRPQPEPLPQRA